MFLYITKNIMNISIQVLSSGNFDVSTLCILKKVRVVFNISRFTAQNLGCYTRHRICNPDLECFNVFYWRCKLSVFYVPLIEKNLEEKFWVSDGAMMSVHPDRSNMENFFYQE